MTDELLEKAAALKKRRVAIQNALKAVEDSVIPTFYVAGDAMNRIKDLGSGDELYVNFFSQLCEFIEVNLQTRLKEVQEEYANL